MKLTISELEKILQTDDEVALTILPNGEIVASVAGIDIGDRKPVTFRENLGGEYGLFPHISVESGTVGTSIGFDARRF